MTAYGLKVAERLDRKSAVDENRCWIWQSASNGGGYGRISIREDGVTYSRSAHRVSYEVHVGPIPDGLDIDHLCRVRKCINPAHLEPVTHRENLMRSPIVLTALNAAKTHCPQGHEYTPENTSPHGPRGGRQCRTCRARPGSGLVPDDPRHGTLNGYTNQACRCPACTAAMTDHVRAYRAARKGTAA